jgi:hypothetical protein
VISRVVRTFASWRSALVSTSALGVTAALALSAAPALACTNEQLRQESNVDPATGQPYSAGLPDCRAYEMVSPLYKQSYDAKPTPVGVPVAPEGETVGFQSEGDFGEPENYEAAAFSPALKYTSRRGASGWITSSTFAPSLLVPIPTYHAGLDGDFSPDLRSSQVSCGPSLPGKVETIYTGFVCAKRTEGGEWKSTAYTYLTNRPSPATAAGYLGGSSDMSRVFIQPTKPLLANDNLVEQGSDGIYEIAGVGSESPQLRLVNVDNQGNELAIERSPSTYEGPLIGDGLESPLVEGTAYQAISESGETVFFTAQRKGSVVGSPLIVYARIPCVAGPDCATGRETVAVSNPSLNISSQWQCKKCEPGSTPESATFQGASADGSKVFFTTTQQLLNKDATLNLYEYDFNRPPGEKLVLLSAAPKPETEGAGVRGVLRTSSDGSHVYFVAVGVLTSVANGNGEKATSGKSNLYGYDTDTGEIKFVAAIKINLATLYSGAGSKESRDSERHAQTTPDGRYLVFSSEGALAGATNGNTAQGVYRYEFETGEVTWVSHAGLACAGEAGEPGCGQGGRSAWVAALPGKEIGAEADINDWNRAISGCPNGVTESEKEQCPGGTHDGEYIVFGTGEKLQNADVNKSADVYEWHCSSPCHNPAGEGVVSMISDGHSSGGGSGGGGESVGAPLGGMSASGSDIFFFTFTSLVGQDTDPLRDMYDARVDGGFKAPVAEPSCSGEACQGTSSTKPSSFGSATSSLFIAGGNLSPVSGSLAFRTSTPKPLTRAQHLAKALKACKGKPRKGRVACESLARKKYGAKVKAKSKAKKAAGRGR